MKKGKAITLLTLVCLVLAFCTAISFIRFPVGTKNFNSVFGAIDFDYDLVGGQAYTLTLKDDSIEVGADDIGAVRKTVSDRLAALGYKTYSVSSLLELGNGAQDYSLLVCLKPSINRYGSPDVSSLTEDVETACAYGTVQFFGGTTSSPDTEIMNDETAVADSYYGGSYKNTDGSVYQYVVIKLTDYGYKELLSNIEANDEYYLKISLGDETIMSASQVSKDSLSNNSLMVTMKGDSQEVKNSATRMALKIKTGGMEYKYEIDEDYPSGVTITAGYDYSPLAFELTVAALLLIAVIALSVMFKGYGVIACLSALTFYIAIFGMFVAVPGVTLSTAGFAGVALAAVLFADGLFIYAKRIKEEYILGKTVKAAVKVGYKRSFIPIMNATVVSGIIAVCGYAFLGGAIQSFFIALGIGAVMSFICTVLIAKMFTELILPLTSDQEKFFGLKREEK